MTGFGDQKRGKLPGRSAPPTVERPFAPPALTRGRARRTTAVSPPRRGGCETQGGRAAGSAKREAVAPPGPGAHEGGRAAGAGYCVTLRRNATASSHDWRSRSALYSSGRLNFLPRSVAAGLVKPCLPPAYLTSL